MASSGERSTGAFDVFKALLPYATPQSRSIEFTNWTACPRCATPGPRPRSAAPVFPLAKASVGQAEKRSRLGKLPLRAPRAAPSSAKSSPSASRSCAMWPLTQESMTAAFCSERVKFGTTGVLCFSRGIARSSWHGAKVGVALLQVLAARTPEGVQFIHQTERWMRLAARQIGSTAAFLAFGRVRRRGLFADRFGLWGH